MDCYITNPFSNALKEKAYLEAIKGVGLDPEEILKDRFSVEDTLNGKKFVVDVCPSTIVPYEIVLSMTEDFSNTRMENLTKFNKKDLKLRSLVKDGKQKY